MPTEKIMIERHDGVMTAITWDGNGTSISYDLNAIEIDFCGELLARARSLRPAWDRERLQLEEAKAAETEAKKQALATAAQKEQERAEAVAELLALSEMLYGEGTDTPLPEVPEPGVTP